MILKYLLLNLLCIAVSVKCLRIDYPFVKTPLGGIKGYNKKSAEGRQYEAYESIPYAKPPIEELRFEPPVPINPWSKVIEALSLPPSCAQYDYGNLKPQGVEDCLYLNIYTPAKSKTDSLPVIFWISGGGFQSGTSVNYGPKFLMDRDVILVTFNYRVGPFGFLTTGDNVVPGNMGLKDQTVALKWVSDNIKYFGGDSKRITLMGVSAGSASVHYHYLSPLSRGLFRNGISFSGTAMSHWAFAPENTQSTKDLAASFKCPTDSSISMIQCLKNISSDDVIDAVHDLTPYAHVAYVRFPPVAEKINENYFINDTPTNIITNGKAYDAPWIAGIVKDEGTFITAGFALKKDILEFTDKNWESVSPYIFAIRFSIPEYKHAEIAIKSKKHYFGDESFSTDMKSIKKLTSLIGDQQIAIGAIRAAKLQARYSQSPVRFYFYSYRAAQSFSDHISNSTIDFGVSHDDDIFMVFDSQFIDATTTAKDRAMQQDMINFWYSYVSTGEPNLGTPWPSLKEPSDNLHYMHIAGPRNFSMESRYNLAEESFWRQIGV